MDYSTIAAKALMLELASFAVAKGLKSGAFASHFRGRGIEFDLVRQYQLGDDARAIDWNVSARSDKTFVKVFEEERDAPVFAIVDASLSMLTGVGAKTRLEQAMEAAALIAFAAERLGCPVGGVAFDGGLGPLLRPASGRERVLNLLYALLGFVPSTRGTALFKAASAALSVLPASSLVVVISDFRVEGFALALGQLKMRHTVVALRIADPADEALPGSGLLRLRDAETGRVIFCRPRSHTFQARWKNKSEERIRLWRASCLKCGAAPFTLSTEDDAAATLAAFFASPASLPRGRAFGA